MQENLEDQQLVKEFYKFLKQTKTGTLATFPRKSELMKLYERSPEAVDEKEVERLVTHKLHIFYEDLMDHYQSGEKFEFPPKLVELLLEQLKDTTMSFGGKVKLNIDIDFTDSSRLKFEQEKMLENGTALKDSEQEKMAADASNSTNAD